MIALRCVRRVGHRHLTVAAVAAVGIIVVVVAVEQYEAALSASQAEDPLLEDRKRVIVDTINAIETRLKEVQANSQAVEEAIYQKLQVCCRLRGA